MKKQSIFTITVTILVIVAATTTAPVSFNHYIVKFAARAQLLQQHQTSSRNSSLRNIATSHSLPLKDIFKQVQNSTVQIVSKIPSESTPDNPESPQQNATALGSGFIYDTVEYCGPGQQNVMCAIAAHIITNNHVVGTAKIVEVTFVDGNRYTAKVVGTDIYRDIAVLQIVQNTTTQKQQQSPIKPLAIGNSSNLEVGDPVIAIGNPFGLSDTMTTGIVSGVGRLLPSDADVESSIPNAIQTDAPINPGNSGGPLLNSQGQVVGMNTAILSDTSGFSGIGFAVPSNTIAKIVPTLIENGSYPHPYLGLAGSALKSDISQNITGITAGSNLTGIVVDTITKNGPADKAGIHGITTDQYSQKHVGDIITAIDGRHITKNDDLISYLDQHTVVGDKVTLTVFRNGHTLDLKATLTARPSIIPFLTTRVSPPAPNPHIQPPTPGPGLHP
jgi:S1-C subfamily serine protease